MSLYIGCALCIVLCFVGKITEKKIFNPLTSFYALWALILILNSLNLFRINVTRSEIYYYILLGLIAYAVGFYLVRGISRKKRLVLSKRGNNKAVQKNYRIKYGLLYTLSFITLVIFATELTEMISILLSGGGLDLVRYTAQNSEITRSAILNALDVLVATPFYMALQPIVAVDFWIGKRDKKLLLLDIILIVIRVLSDGGRSAIINLVLNLVIVYTFVTNANRSNYSGTIKNYLKKNKKLVSFIFIVGLISLIYTTISRNSTWRTLYYYFAMEPYMFDRWALQVDHVNLFGYGMASLNGFFFALFYILKNILGFKSFPKFWYSVYEMISKTDSQWQIITTGGTKANAYVSLFWFFYLDGRVWGIIIGSLLYGMLMSCLYSGALKRANIKNVCLYSFMVQGLLFSFVRMQFSSIYYAIATIMICLICFKKVSLYDENKDNLE